MEVKDDISIDIRVEVYVGLKLMDNIILQVECFF